MISQKYFIISIISVILVSSSGQMVLGYGGPPEQSSANNYTVEIISDDISYALGESVIFSGSANKYDEERHLRISIFSTGNKELIGLLHLEDESGFPIVADKNLEIDIDSSDKDFLSIDPVFFPLGHGTSLVFAEVGLIIPEGIDSDEFEINPVVEVEDESATTTEVEIFGPEEDTLKLVAEPLIDKSLSDTEFPIVVYLTDDNEVTKFPKNSNLFSSPSDVFEIETKLVTRGDDLIMLNALAIDKGEDTIQFTVNDVADAEVTIESLLLKPANIVIEHSETIFTGTNDVFSIQLVNSQGLPVFATEDVEISFVINDESLIQVPSTATIKKGDYFTLFDVGPKAGGTTEISALSEGFPISTTNVQLKSLIPTLFLDTPELIENGDVFTAKIAANQDGNPLAGMKVNWNIDGGILQLSDKKTSASGEAIASIIPTSDKKVNVQASVSSTYYSPAEITNVVRVNATSEFVAFAEEPEFTKPEIAGIDPVIIIVPTMLILMGFMLMKKGIIKIKNTPLAPNPVPIQEV